MTDTFDPADAGCWMARGRPAHHALALADAWRRFPDLPNEAPLGARMARSRERVQALRPLNEAIAQETERQRKAANFAFVERQIAQGSTDSRNRAILHARDVHGYDWDAAVAYANGNHAAIAGWPGRPPSPSRRGEPDVRRLGYDQGFLDGGGRPEDIFDVARRSFLAAPPEPSFEASRAEQPRIARPLPSQWPAPTDTPAPVSWHRRLLVLGASESATGAIGIRAMLRERPGHEAAGLYILGGDSGLHLITATTGATPGDQTALRHALRQGDYTDILVVADDAEIARLDADADILPLARTMERTRNSVLQQRAHFRLWLARGRAPGDQFAAGHIRWSRMAAGLSGRLGDFTARYAGPARPRGHRIIVEDMSGGLAHGYRTPLGRELRPEIVIGNKAHARTAMADLLRQYAASLRLG
ncbi:MULTISPECIES: hypothetical protein [Sphingobium]|jgi:hypothetical protein|uniref:hypothetical protein n=1 Tax=Sphingobium TaxID=165695 RepID=UPI0004E469EC|nr:MULTISPECIES: hypothetical protein [Sphingobium]KFD26697.1 hypothetical protein IH86_18815 [Sphingobium yanoikuyae]MDV3481984.1 hypothetical protein [Sphingobium yanoikuyae]HUD91673.1 hypothetical protein [Sphingobium sp.]